MKSNELDLNDVLGQLVSRNEAIFYLERYQSLQRQHCLLIRIDSQVLSEDFEELCAALAFLWRLGLRPVILHDFEWQLASALDKQGGVGDAGGELLRVDPDVMAKARPLAYGETQRLIHALEGRGIPARAVQHGVFTCDWLDRENRGLIGRIDTVNIAPITDLVGNQRIPVLTCLGETPCGQMLLIDGDQAMLSLSTSLQACKIVFLTRHGALIDRKSRPISVISLSSDYDYLTIQSLVQSSLQQRTGLIYRMLELLDSAASASVTRPALLTRELFSHSGAGTLVRKGERIDWYDTPSRSVVNEVIPLLEHSFSRKLSSNWVKNQKMHGLLLAESRRGAAVVLEGQRGIPYLDKIMVTPKARGEGLGAALWQALRGRLPAMYWRSRINNPINGWYFQRSEASRQIGRWIMFSTGISDFEVLGELYADAYRRDSGWASARNPEES